AGLGEIVSAGIGPRPPAGWYPCATNEAARIKVARVPDEAEHLAGQAQLDTSRIGVGAAADIEEALPAAGAAIAVNQYMAIRGDYCTDHLTALIGGAARTGGYGASNIREWAPRGAV